MDPLNEAQTEALLLPESRILALPTGGHVEVTATRHHWLVAEELQTDYGWSLAEICRLALDESVETGRDFALCFRYLIAYIQAASRHQLDESLAGVSPLPLLPNRYAPGDTALR
ncbi:hypothetical protein [Botrimarina hoheduenensis]|uniref:Uncharacterized protein n=1 Tax=Botrimarina hoheduenensis TaxID=2528000 RepID=A0A5C5VUR7_9BACT|nr:hypothetical protein [Botrimarina hoheduenensis]TWT41389.1 hypothetical protein Pla111_31030 [Botrimarina hoheduenensis]